MQNLHIVYEMPNIAYFILYIEKYGCFEKCQKINIKKYAVFSYIYALEP